MLIYPWVQTRFRYHVAKYFLSIFKKAGFNTALMVGKGVFLICEQGFRDLGVSRTTMSSGVLLNYGLGQSKMNY